MFDTLDEIQRQLADGEDARAEFKELVLGPHGVRATNTEEMAGDMVAFANAEGGAIFLGVEDSGIVRGLPEDRLADIERWVVNIATHNCDPPLRPILRKERLLRPDGSEATIMVVEVRRDLYVHGTSGGRHHVRVGSSKCILTGLLLARLFQECGRAFVFDEQPVPTASEEDFDRQSLVRLFQNGAPAIPWPDLLRNTRVLARSDDGPDRPTVAGPLVFGKTPRATFLPHTLKRRCIAAAL